MVCLGLVGLWALIWGQIRVWACQWAGPFLQRKRPSEKAEALQASGAQALLLGKMVPFSLLPDTQLIASFVSRPCLPLCGAGAPCALF